VQAVAEIDQNSKLIETLTGQPPHFFRPPYGLSTPYLRDYVRKNYMIYMNWSGSAKDWEPTAHDEPVFMKNITDRLQPGGILLVHEHPWTVAYLDDLITLIQSKGYTFVDPNTIVEQ
jgi:peptidoglycan-N-acetylglucosamine deacetylase